MESSGSQIRRYTESPGGARQVELWTASLELPADALERLEQSLSGEEKERAMRFRFEKHRNRFIAGRGLLRRILGSYLEAEPGVLEFVFGPFGKPELGGAFAGSGLRFNLAHCEATAIIGVTRDARIGVDVERVRSMEDADELVARFFSPRESKAFAELQGSAKAAAFFNLWTRKEAWLKATGEGIGQNLNRVEVSFLPGEPARLKTLPANLGDPKKWTLHSGEPARGFVAAVAVEGSCGAVQWRGWKEDGPA